MTDTLTIWKNSFTTEHVPDWTCPSCNKGTLKGIEKDFSVFTNANSIQGQKHDFWEPEMNSGHFNGILTCSNQVCSEKVIMTGEMGMTEEPDFDEDHEGWYGYKFVQELTPTYFIPALNLIQIHEEVPNEIAEAIKQSFKIYWLDTASCANKIRVVIELIMDEQKVAKTYTHNNRRQGHKLHKRIELFRANKPDEADLLMAIKWIGNSGSHQNEALIKDDLLDAYEILEHVTTRLYETKTKRIKKMTKTINKTRKPIGKKRT